MYITLAPFSNAFIPSVDASEVLPVEQSPTMNIFCLFKAKSNSFNFDRSNSFNSRKFLYCSISNIYLLISNLSLELFHQTYIRHHLVS
mgnify:CR=1 FL=1